jgi:TrmH family RNA methyltransferase
MPQPNEWASVVADVRRAQSPGGRAQLREFAVEGVRLVERAHRAGQTPRRLVVSQRQLRGGDERILRLVAELQGHRCEIFAAPDAVVVELAGGRAGSSMFGLCGIPDELALDELVARTTKNRTTLLVLVDVEEPGNVGALIRTALAGGAAGLIAIGLSDPFHPKAVRTSMGSLFKLPIVRAAETAPVLAAFSGSATAAMITDGGKPPWQLPFAQIRAVFVGRESEGLSAELRSRLDYGVTIPMPSGVDSFSVNAAASIVLYEAIRQRTQSGLPTDRS